ncbi:MAG TPA: hypothetical protein VFS15_07915 [Kofleriaceae bacterium]|nr:hypothetical protein [Kofleriaceae bacterium]
MRPGLAIVAVLAFACGPAARGGGGDDDGMGVDAASGGGSGAAGVFDPSIDSVVVEIDYETGQEPYTGPILGFGDTFDPAVTNLDRLFSGTKQLTVPRTLAEMEDIGAIDDEDITVDDLQAIAQAHRNTYDSETRRSYYVVFLSGHFSDASGPQNFVLDVSVGNTVAMFKDVIRSTDIVVAPNVVRYVEQSTLIHELAHSIGLVDNGVPMALSHDDAAHRPHCNNPDCVMYWQNEGSSDAVKFAQQQLVTGSSILFDAACLADVDAMTAP